MGVFPVCSWRGICGLILQSINAQITCSQHTVDLFYSVIPTKKVSPSFKTLSEHSPKWVFVYESLGLVQICQMYWFCGKGMSSTCVHKNSRGLLPQLSWCLQWKWLPAVSHATHHLWALCHSFLINLKGIFVVLGFSNFVICLWALELPCLSNPAASQRFVERYSMGDLASLLSFFFSFFFFFPSLLIAVVCCKHQSCGW